MKDPRDVAWSEMTVEEWLESYRQKTHSGEGKRGSAWPMEGVIQTVMPGPFPDWHYYAFGLRSALETVVKQQKEIEDLRGRIKLLEKMSLED